MNELCWVLWHNSFYFHNQNTGICVNIGLKMKIKPKKVNIFHINVCKMPKNTANS
jgi:hypothetical protein